MRKKCVVVSAFIASSLSFMASGVTATAAAHAAADCLAAPNAPTPQGQHWYYRMDRATKRKCWYLGAEGRATRPEVSTTTASPQPEQSPAPRIEAKPRVPAPAAVETASQFPDAPVLNQMPSPVPSRVAPAPAGDSTSGAEQQRATPSRAADDTQAATAEPAAPTPDVTAQADIEDEMPAVWPVLTAEELAVSAPAQATVVRPQYLLAALAGALALAGLLGHMIFRQTARRRLARRHALDLEPAASKTLIPRDMVPRALGRENGVRRVEAPRRTRDPAPEIEEALRQLVRASRAPEPEVIWPAPRRYAGLSR